jgi:hypothetical protein
MVRVIDGLLEWTAWTAWKENWYRSCALAFCIIDSDLG